jgi:hypothetical protein
MTSMMTQAEHKEHALQNKTIEPAEAANASNNNPTLKNSNNANRAQ